jgi:O-antigen/teichoic acid export membrane protein
VALILNFSFALALIPLWGAVGASVAIMVSIVVWNVLLVILVNKRLNIRCSAFWW